MQCSMKSRAAHSPTRLTQRTAMESSFACFLLAASSDSPDSRCENARKAASSKGCASIEEVWELIL